MISHVKYDLDVKINKGTTYSGNVLLSFYRTKNLENTDLVFDF